jgi:general secretion pathway protein C
MQRLSRLAEAILFASAHTPGCFHLSLRIASAVIPSVDHYASNPGIGARNYQKMQQISLDRSNLPQTTLVALVTVAALALLAVVAAYWTWTWFAPRPELRAQAAAVPGGGISADELFGNVQRDQNSTVSTGMAIRLLGIVAATEGHLGYAVVQLDTKEILAVPEGEDVFPGLWLAEVGIDFIVIERGGIRETLAWPESSPVPEPRANQ